MQRLCQISNNKECISNGTITALGELLDVTKERFAYIDRHIGELEEKRKKIVNEIYTIEKEAETSSY